MKSLCVSLFLLLGAVCAEAQVGTTAPDSAVSSDEKVSLPDLLAPADPFLQPSVNSSAALP